MRVLLDEMYPAALAVRSRAAAIEAATAADLTLGTLVGGGRRE